MKTDKLQGGPISHWKETKAYYEKMPYLRDIDCQVIEKVMGWTVAKKSTLGWCPGGKHENFAIKEVWLVNKDSWPFPSVFVPTENESDSGAVEDKLAELGWLVTVHWGDRLGDGINALVSIQRNRGNPQTPFDMVLVESETRPLAICLAALEAVERWAE